MKTTNLLLAVLCLTGLTAPAAAEIGKLSAATRNIIQKTPTHIQGPKRFVYPKHFITAQGTHNLSQLNAALQRNITQTQAAATVAPLTPLPGFAILSQGTPEKTFLELTQQEEAFYQKEIIPTINLISQIGMVQNLMQKEFVPPEDLLLHITKNLTYIKNDYLRTMSLNLWEEGKLETLQMELTQYYSLGLKFEDAAFNYSLRHPYKRNLQTMRLLHNPFIDKKFKEPVESFINRPLISLADKDAFKKALKDLQAEYERIHTKAGQTPAVQMQIQYYQQTIEELTAFIQKTNRRPKWNTRNKAEQELNDRIEYLLHSAKQYNYEPFVEYSQQLRTAWDAHAPQYWSKEQTLQAFEQFLQHAPQGHLYPRSLREGENISPEEEMLFDNLMYWRIQDDANFNAAINQIQQRHAQK